MFVGGAGVANRSLEVVAEAVPVLERADDDAGLARAARLEMYSQVMLGRFTDATASSVRIVDHARRAGDERLVSRSVAAIANILVHGPAPVEAATAQTRELLARRAGRPEGGGDPARRPRPAPGNGRGVRGRAGELPPSPGDPRPSSDRASTRARRRSIRARVELLAGNADGRGARAPAGLRRRSRRSARRYLRSTVAAMLGEAHWELGELEEADRFSAIAKSLADEDDVVSQVLWRATAARVQAVMGDITAAIELAEAGVAAAADDRGGRASTRMRSSRWRSFGRVRAGTTKRERPLADALALRRRREIERRRESSRRRSVLRFLRSRRAGSPFSYSQATIRKLLPIFVTVTHVRVVRRTGRRACSAASRRR